MNLVDQIRGHKRALDVTELAEILNVHVRTIYNEVASGHIPFFRVRNGIRFDPSQTADWLEARMWGAGDSRLSAARRR